METFCRYTYKLIDGIIDQGKWQIPFAQASQWCFASQHKNHKKVFDLLEIEVKRSES